MAFSFVKFTSPSMVTSILVDKFLVGDEPAFIFAIIAQDDCFVVGCFIDELGDCLIDRASRRITSTDATSMVFTLSPCNNVQFASFNGGRISDGWAESFAGIDPLGNELSSPTVIARRCCSTSSISSLMTARSRTSANTSNNNA